MAEGRGTGRGRRARRRGVGALLRRPPLAVSVGVSGAGLAATFEPWRPYFVAGTVLSIVLGFVLLDREEKKACEPGRACADPGVRRTMRATLWIATGLAALLVIFPSWQGLLL